MKVYIVQSVELDQEENEVWGYIYPNDQLMQVFKSFDGALKFCKDVCCMYWDAHPENLYTVKDSEDPTITYVKEKPNVRTVQWPILWAVIIEREV